MDWTFYGISSTELCVMLGVSLGVSLSICLCWFHNVRCNLDNMEKDCKKNEEHKCDDNEIELKELIVNQLYIPNPTYGCGCTHGDNVRCLMEEKNNDDYDYISL